MTSLKKKSIFFVTFIIAIVFVVFMAFGVYFAAGDIAGIASSAELKDATVGDRIEMIDLWERYPIRVIGPLASKNGSGQYVDSSGNRVKDLYGEFTNNIYKIPAKQYFNAETYLYTEPNNDDIDIGTGKGRTLYGWKPDIEPVDPDTGVDINETDT